jgi:hypothetical protein
MSEQHVFETAGEEGPRDARIVMTQHTYTHRWSDRMEIAMVLAQAHIRCHGLLSGFDISAIFDLADSMLAEDRKRG